MHFMQSAPGPETMVDGHKYLYFCGTGYLGLHGHKNLIQAACDAMQIYGMGTATSRAGYGNARPTIEVEQRAARFWDCEDAYYFASGYLGNHVMLSALSARASTVFVDEHSHYSVVDACQFLDLPMHSFAHREAQALRQSLHDHMQPGQVPVVLSDGVFAARGSMAPVPDYIDVLHEFPGAKLCLDDCHAYGVLGAHGRGTYEHFGLLSPAINQSLDGGPPPNSPQLFTVGTLSKAFGSYGGIICGSHAFIEDAKNRSHYYCGASAPPIPVAAASAAALELVAEAPHRIRRLQRNALILKHRLKGLGLDVDETPVPIVSLTLGDRRNMQRIQQALADEGILIAYSAQYSGLGEQGALRIALFATHEEEMICQLVECMEKHL